MTVPWRACADMSLGARVAGGPTPGPATLPNCEGGTDATRRPITDLGTGCYLQYRGGLYPNGENALSGAHLAAGLAAAARIAPLDVAGQPTAGGKDRLRRIGESDTNQGVLKHGVA